MIFISSVLFDLNSKKHRNFKKNSIQFDIPGKFQSFTVLIFFIIIIIFQAKDSSLPNRINSQLLLERAYSDIKKSKTNFPNLSNDEKLKEKQREQEISKDDLKFPSLTIVS